MRSAFVGTVSMACAIVLSFGTDPYGQPRTTYRIESRSKQSEPVRRRFSDAQLALLEKLNRADVDLLDTLSELVVLESWDVDELTLSPLPSHYPPAASMPKLVVVHLPGQAFGVYKTGVLVRWGPISSGGPGNPTPGGHFNLTWRSAGHSSTVDSEWYLRWYFNFASREGLAFHEYSLPGLPASHGCIRLLERDGRWLFAWGEGWKLDADNAQVVERGTPVFVVGAYDFDAPPPWRSMSWLNHAIDLPSPFIG